MAEITGKDVDFVLQEMPLTCARTYEHIFYVKHDIPYRSILEQDDEDEGLQTRI